MMIRNSRLWVCALAILCAVWIIFFRQTSKFPQHFPSGPPSSAFHIKSKMIEMGEEKSLSAYGDMEVYLRMTSKVPIFTNFYENILVRSMRYFWPDISSMVVVLDQEKATDHVFGNFIRNTFPYPRICYMDNLKVIGYKGKDRMQRDMFYPERCTSKKYIAFVDTDTMFITRIVPEMLFADGKPIIIAIYGKEISPFWLKVAHSTANLFHTKEVMRCMAYFPVVLKIEHIIQARQYIEKIHNMTLEDAFMKKKNGVFAQFNIMCQYIWLFYRNEYEFHFQLQDNEIQLPKSYRKDILDIQNIITEEQMRPVARLCAHYKYVDEWESEHAYRDLFRSSICFAGGFGLCPEKCKAYDKTSLRKYMFYFSKLDWRWDSRCHVVQEEHYSILARYASEDYSDIIRKGCHEMDTLTWSANKTLTYFHNQSLA